MSSDNANIEQVLSRLDVLYLAMGELIGHDKLSQIMDRIIAEKSGELAVMEAQKFLTEEASKHPDK